MVDIKVKDIVRVCSAKLVYGNENIVCENYSRDTRDIQKNDVYVGIKGQNFDGNLFYEEALEKGASVCILQSDNIDINKLEKFENIAIIRVEDTIKALQEIATYKRSLYNIPVVAITGSVGKTSTKDIIASVMSEKYNVLKTEGNLNNHIGLPLTILKLKEHDAMVVEMGMSALGEIRTLTNIAKPTMCVITNVGTSHIGELGSRENILKAKLEILEGMQKDGILVINNDNDLLHIWNENNKEYSVKTYGIENTSDIVAQNIVLDENGSSFNVTINNNTHNVKVPVGGNHFVLNSLCAINVGLQNGIEIEKIINGIAKFELTKNRMDIQKNSNNVTIINGSYNASYDSMKASIEHLANLKGRKIAVLGDMLELGEFSKELHEKVGYEVYKNNIDILVVCGKEAKYISSKAIELGMNKSSVFEFNELNDVVDYLKSMLKSEDIVLVKASNGMKFHKIVSEIL